MNHILRFDSEAAYRAHLARITKLGEANHPPNVPTLTDVVKLPPGTIVTGNKYSNEKTIVDGLRFDSAKEANRYRTLKTLERGKFISELTRQVSFPIIVNGYQVCEYVADFVYWDAKSKRVVEDVKGCRTDVYKLKRKLFQACYRLTITET